MFHTNGNRQRASSLVTVRTKGGSCGSWLQTGIIGAFNEDTARLTLLFDHADKVIDSILLPPDECGPFAEATVKRLPPLFGR
jgi:hypothetical protein